MLGMRRLNSAPRCVASAAVRCFTPFYPQRDRAPLADRTTANASSPVDTNDAGSESARQYAKAAAPKAQRRSAEAAWAEAAQPDRGDREPLYWKASPVQAAIGMAPGMIYTRAANFGWPWITAGFGVFAAGAAFMYLFGDAYIFTYPSDPDVDTLIGRNMGRDGRFHFGGAGSNARKLVNDGSGEDASSTEADEAAQVATAAGDTASKPAGAPPKTTPPRYEDVEAIIYRDMPEEYNELGQVDPKEVKLTVAPNAFTQIGVLLPDGVRKLVSDVGLTLGGTGLSEHDVFADIGSGVGNICIQVLLETPCKRTVGVELLPSRQEHAERAFANAKREFPQVFEGKAADWPLCDLVKAGPPLVDAGTSVVFTHSWMFDDALMLKLGDVLNDVPTLQAVVTSRPIPNLLHCDDGCERKHQLRFHTRTSYSADWNPESPFHVYTSRPIAGQGFVKTAWSSATTTTAAAEVPETDSAQIKGP